jgi:hypothetical protein
MKNPFWHKMFLGKMGIVGKKVASTKKLYQLNDIK